jgi:hypothetical protein
MKRALHALGSHVVKRQAWLGLAMLGVLLLPAVRAATEASMTRHMLLQFPALMLGGALLAAAMPHAGSRRLARWNELGIAGLVGVALVLAVAMVPRLLDLALVEPAVEAGKLLALAAAGAALRWSWRPAGTLVQAFFLGNVLPMMAVVGITLQDTPQRVCNAYRMDDQQTLGLALGWLALGLGLAWLAGAARR